MSWVLRDQSGAYHLLTSVIKMGIQTPRKKERKNKLDKDHESEPVADTGCLSHLRKTDLPAKLFRGF